MSVHVWNNYFDGNSKYGVGAAYKSNAFVEANYFRNCKYPMLISLQGSDVATNPKGTFSGEDGGMIKSFNNIITGAIKYVTYQKAPVEFDAYEAASREETVPSTVKAKVGGRIFDNWDVDPSIMYTYTPDAPADVPSVVTGWLGAGRMGHGDFQWTFDNATEDNNSNVITGLKNALQNYKTKLIGIYSEVSGGGEQPTPDPTPEPTPDPTPDPTPTPAGNIFTSFAKDGTPSNSFFTVSGNGANNKGTVTIDGTEYSTCLKMESATSIKFTIDKTMNMTLYFGPTETASIKIALGSNDPVKIAGSGNTHSQQLEAGSYTLSKDKSVNLFGIKLEEVEQ
jgi:hypothetical protein